jgi:hypothetical protein
MTHHIKKNKPLSENWYLKLVDPQQHRALWLRFTKLITKKPQTAIAEVWGIYFEKTNDGTIKKSAVKETFPLSDFHDLTENDAIEIKACSLDSTKTKGTIASESNHLNWDLTFHPKQKINFNFVPTLLKKLKIVKNTVWTLQEDLLFSGKVTLNKREIIFDKALGMIGHYYGPKSGHEWQWAHANSFLDANNKLTQTIFDGIRAQARIGNKITTPYLTTMLIHFQNKTYHFNTMKALSHIKSQFKDGVWSFEAKEKDIIFKGRIWAPENYFAGITYTDTDHSKLYCYNSKLANIVIDVYNNNSLIESLTAKETAAFEYVQRHTDPNVELVL